MKSIYRQRLLATTLFVGAGVLANPAQAQTAQPTQQTGQAGDESATPATGPIEGAPQESVNAEGQTVENPADIVVTGSRIPRANIEAPSPVTVVNSEQVELTGTTNVETLLNELPQVIPGNTRVSNNAGGENFSTLDLRGLGPGRTLILLDGERVAPSTTTGVVDVGQVPTGLIQRVEVVTGGASAVYGSDAIAGVVNFILKQNYSGLEIVGQTGISQTGTGGSYTVSGLLGGNFGDDKGNLTVYTSYTNRDSLSQGRYGYSRTSAAVLGRFNEDGFATDQPVVVDTQAEAIALLGQGYEEIGLGGGGSGTNPFGVVTNSASNPFRNLNTAVGGNFASFDRDCNPATANTSTTASNLSFDANGNLRPTSIGGTACVVPTGLSTRFNFAPLNYAITPYNRIQLTALGHYDFSDQTRLKVYSSFTNSQQQVNLAPTPATGIVVPYNSPLIPADLAAALATRPNPTAPFTYARRFTETGPRDGRFKTNSFNVRGVLEHDLSTNWKSTFVLGYGQVDNVQRGIGNINRTAVAQGLAGCPVGASLPGCVPINIFGQNTLTPAQLAFVRIDTQQQETFNQQRAAVNVSGRAFDLPGGPIGLAFGAEYRKDKGSSIVDDAQRTGDIYGFNAVQSIEGSINVKEVYGEVLLPVFNFIQLGTGARYSDYSTVGGLFNWKVEGELRPLSWAKVRATFNKAARAPNVFELYQNGDQGFASFSDPCRAASNPNRNTAQCLATGVPASLLPTFAATNSQVEVYSFGARDLQEEKAKTYTVGAVLTPRVLGNPLALTVDYYNIRLTNRVASLGSAFYLGGCYTGNDPTACARITRDPATGQITRINLSRTNSAVPLNTAGVDVGFDYSFGAGFLPGRFYLSDVLTYVDKYQIGDQDFVDTTFSGIGGVTNRWANTLTAGYRTNRFTGQLRYVWKRGGKQNFPGSDLDGIYPEGSSARIPDLNLLNLSLRYAVNDQFEITGIVNNLLNKFPPQTATGVLDQANTNAAFYDPYYVGRNFTIQARVRL